MYNLAGTSEPPRPAGKIHRDVPSKVWYNEMLPVHNWLKKPQRLVHRLFFQNIFKQGVD